MRILSFLSFVLCVGTAMASDYSSASLRTLKSKKASSGKKASGKKASDVSGSNQEPVNCNPATASADRNLGDLELGCVYSCLDGRGRDGDVDAACDETTLAAVGVASCNGAEACVESTGIIGKASCIGGEQVCKNTFGTIGNGSCLGENGVCSQFNGVVGDNSCIGSSESCSNSSGVIGNGSCQGVRTCTKSTGLDVGSYSCLGGEACSGSVNLTTHQGSCIQEEACERSFNMVVEEKSCIGPKVCDSSLNGAIGPGSCIGLKACADTESILVGKESCIHTGACADVFNTTIANFSCVGQQACFDMENGDIGDRSCIGAGSCAEFLGTVNSKSCVGIISCLRSSGVIGSGSCYGSGACASLEETSIGSTSCIGSISCMLAPNVTIGDESCIGLESCSIATDAVSIGDKSCFGERACFGVSVNIGDNACRCDGCCFCPEPFGANSDVPDGACNTPGSCCTCDGTDEIVTVRAADSGVSWSLTRESDDTIVASTDTGPTQPGCLSVDTECYKFSIMGSTQEGGLDWSIILSDGSEIVSSPTNGNFGLGETSSFGNCVTNRPLVDAQLTLFLDGFPDETYWDLKRESDGAILTSRPQSFYQARRGTEVEELNGLDVESECYLFSMLDSLGDDGADWTIEYGSVLVASPSGGAFGSGETVSFGNCTSNRRFLVNNRALSSFHFKTTVFQDANAVDMTVSALGEPQTIVIEMVSTERKHAKSLVDKTSVAHLREPRVKGEEVVQELSNSWLEAGSSVTVRFDVSNANIINHVAVIRSETTGESVQVQLQKTTE